MSWLSRVVRPKIQAVLRKRDTGDSLWQKCAACDQMIFHRELSDNLGVCPGCDHHMRIAPKERFDALFDKASYETLPTPQVLADPLKFRDQKKYPERLREARHKTGREEAMSVAQGEIDTLPTTVAIQDFAFMGGSMGMAVGESLVMAAEHAVKDQTPLIVFTAAGGARMQESMLSLMQMARGTIAVQMLREAALPYIVVLTDPTTGGVTASYGMLGDIHIAEPNALIGFAGQRVIEQTIREQLPEGFQRAEMLQSQGMVDMVVHRHDIRATLSRILQMLMYDRRQNKVATALPGPASATRPDNITA